MAHNTPPRVTLVVDPRFSGGTSTAVASEIRAIAPMTDLKLVALESSMFRGRIAHQSLEDACDETGTPLEWNPETIRSEIVVLHNPSFLKINQSLSTRIVCDRLFVITHENFRRPLGGWGFDVDHCLDLIDTQTLAQRKFLAPISPSNRVGVIEWVQGLDSRWSVSANDWTNICAFEMLQPTEAPRDRRGRHSRPGFEKFPDLETMKTLFPVEAEAARILGSDSIRPEEAQPHWDLIPFGGEQVSAFLSTIDFFVYFTNPAWRESFGRSIAEAIAAGKLVITDPATASNFGKGVVSAQPAEVNELIAYFISRPEVYRATVRAAQASLQDFSAEAFLERFRTTIMQSRTPTLPSCTKMEKLHALV